MGGECSNGANFYAVGSPPSFTNVVAVAASRGHDLALKADGTVTNWGLTNDVANSVPTNLASAKASTAGWEHNVALLAARQMFGLTTAIVASLLLIFEPNVLDLRLIDHDRRTGHVHAAVRGIGILPVGQAAYDPVLSVDRSGYGSDAVSEGFRSGRRTHPRCSGNCGCARPTKGRPGQSCNWRFATSWPLL